METSGSASGGRRGTRRPSRRARPGLRPGPARERPSARAGRGASLHLPSLAGPAGRDPARGPSGRHVHAALTRARPPGPPPASPRPPAAPAPWSIRRGAPRLGPGSPESGGRDLVALCLSESSVPAAVAAGGGRNPGRGGRGGGGPHAIKGARRALGRIQGGSRVEGREGAGARGGRDAGAARSLERVDLGGFQCFNPPSRLLRQPQAPPCHGRWSSKG